MKRFLFLLLLTGCLHTPVSVDPVVLPKVLMPDRYAQTICSWNNKAVVFVDPSILQNIEAPIILKHEVQHAVDMDTHKGGCWPFLYRYQNDTAFKRQAEFRAYCAEGKEAIKQNRNPIDVWLRIKEDMIFYGAMLTDKDNCLFTSWPDMVQNKPILLPHTPDTKPPL